MGHETWGSHLDYVLTILGFSVGVGSLWKFPYMVMRNGGGAFLIPFLLFTVIGAIPCVFLEMVIGQYSQSGPVKVWNLCPPFKGVGVGTVLITVFFATYYPALFAWFLYYLYHSFSATIPWATCGNSWNTPTCISYYDAMPTNGTNSSITDFGNITVATVASAVANVTAAPGMTAAEEFWRFNVLEITDGLETMGSVRWPLVGCLAITYVMIFACMCQGIKVSGKVVYVTVSVPYLLIAVFLVRGCLLPGSGDGIFYFIYPKFEKLLEPKIWVEACNYALYSLGIAWGCLITMAGHNKFNNNCYRDSLIFCAFDAGTAIFIGFAFFAIMGHVAFQRGVTVEAFESSGFNLGFIVYPEAVASLPLPQVWSALTFVMLMTLGIDSLIPCFEIAVTAIAEECPWLDKRHWLISLIVLIPSFLVGIVYMSQGGMYLLTLVDWYAFFPSMALFAMMECFVVCWIYGTNRIDKDISIMWGKPIPRVLSICMKFVCPILLLIVFCYSLYSYRPPKYGKYIFPGWATGLGWLISFASIAPIPVIFIWSVWKTHGDTLKEKLRNALQPSSEWGPPTQKDTINGDVVESMI